MMRLLKYIIPVLVVLAVLGTIGFLSYRLGVNTEEEKQLEQQLREVEQTSDDIQQGRNEVLRANPNRDADIARERLRQRQASR